MCPYLLSLKVGSLRLTVLSPRRGEDPARDRAIGDFSPEFHQRAGRGELGVAHDQKRRRCVRSPPRAAGSVRSSVGRLGENGGVY
jgi:hypothetical protein